MARRILSILLCAALLAACAVSYGEEIGDVLLSGGQFLDMTYEEIVHTRGRGPDESFEYKSGAVEVWYRFPYEFILACVLKDGRVVVTACYDSVPDQRETGMRERLAEAYGEPEHASTEEVRQFLSDLTGMKAGTPAGPVYQWRADDSTVVFVYSWEDGSETAVYVRAENAPSALAEGEATAEPEEEPTVMPTEIPEEDPEAVMPMPEASGEYVLEDGLLQADASHMGDGYIMVKIPENAEGLAVIAEPDGGAAVRYPLDRDGEYAVIPLQEPGEYYTIRMVREGEDEEECGTVRPERVAGGGCFGFPNIYVDYTPYSPWVWEATYLCAGLESEGEKYEAIIRYISLNYQFDFIKTVTVVPEETYPDIEECWEKKMGTGKDLAGLVCAILRSQGLYAVLFVGGDEYGSYCWVATVADGKTLIYDPTAEMRAGSPYAMIRMLQQGGTAY